MRKFISMVLALVMILSCVSINVSANELVASTKVELYQLAPESQSLMESYVIKTNNDKLIVIDGGIDGAGKESDPYLPSALRAIAGVGEGEYFEVEAWFLSHAHQDHYYELAKMLNEYNEESNYKINNFYFDFPPYGKTGTIWENILVGNQFFEELKSGLDNYAEVNEIEFDSETYYDELNGKVVNATAISEGLDINIDGVRFEIMQTWNEADGTSELNNTSMILRMHTAGKTVLFLNDAYIHSGNRLVDTYGEDLKSDYVQTAHHGQSGTKQNVYDAVDADFFLWPTPKWIWTNPDSYAIDDVRTWIAGEDYLEVRENDLVAGMYDVYPDDPTVVADWADALPGMKITFANEDANYTAPKANKNLKYTGEEQELITEGSTDIGTMEYCIEGAEYSDAIPTAVNAGEYTVYYRITDGSVLVEEAVTVTIAKAEPEFTAPVAKVLFSTGEEQALIEAGSIAEGEFLYSTDDVDYSAEIPTATESGNYTVYYKVEESDNYLEVSGSVDVTIGDYSVTFKNGNELAPFDEAVVMSAMDGECLVELPSYETKANTEFAYFKIGDVRFTEEELLSYEVTANTEVLAYFRETAITDCDYNFTTMTEEEFELTAFGTDSDFVLTEGVGVQLSKSAKATYDIPLATDVSENALSVSYGFTETANTGGFDGHFKRAADTVAILYHTSNYMRVYGDGAAQYVYNLGQLDDGNHHKAEFIMDIENGKQYVVMDDYSGIVPTENTHNLLNAKVPDRFTLLQKANGSFIMDSFSVKRLEDSKIRKVELEAGNGIEDINFMNTARTATYTNTHIYMQEGDRVPLQATLSADAAFSAWEAESGSFSDETAVKTVYTAGDSDVVITAKSDAPSIEDGDVVKIGKEGYATLQEAINAATDGQTITLLTDITYTDALVFGTGKNITIDGDGNDLICGINVAGTNCVYVKSDTKVTFENINIYRNNTTTNNYGFFYLSTGGVTLGDGAVLGSATTQMVQGNGGVIWAQKSSTDEGTGKRYFTLNGEGAKIQNIKGSWQKGVFDGSSSAEVNLLKGTIDKCTHTTAFVGNRGNFVVNLGDVTITNSKEPMVNGTTSTTVNITGNGTLGTVIAASGKISFKKILSYDSPAKTYQGSDFNGSVKLNVLDTTVPQSYALVESGMNVTGAKLATGEDLVVNSSGNLVVAEYVAKIGDVKYTSLQTAINAAVTGDTVTLLSDITLDEQLIFNTGKSIIVDGANFDLTTNVAPDAPMYIAKATNVLFKNIDLKKGVTTQNNYGFFYISTGSVTLGDYAVLGGTASGVMNMGNGGVVWVQRATGETGRAHFTLNGEGAKIQYVKADWEKGVFDGANELDVNLLKGTVTGCISTKGLILGKSYFNVRLGDVVIENSSTPTVEGTSIYKIMITGSGALGTIKAPASKINFVKSLAYGADALVYEGGNFNGSVVLNLTDSAIPESYAIVESGMTVTGAKNADGRELIVDSNGKLVVKPATELTSASEVVYDESDENEVQYTFSALAGETPSALTDAKGGAVAYTYSENTLTIDEAYLKALEKGTYPLTLTFTNGTEFSLSVVKVDTSKVTYVLAEAETGKGTGALVLTNLSGKDVKSISYNNGTALDFTASDDGKTITIERYVFRANMDLYATLTLEEDGIVPVTVTFEDDTTKTYNVTITSEWAKIPAVDAGAVFLADEIVPAEGAWMVRTSSANGGAVHPRYAFTGKLKNAKNSQNWHTAYTLVNNTPIGDTKLDHYIDIDFGTAPINYKGVRITERVSGNEYNKITIYGKNADNEEWAKLFEGAATKEAPASNDLMFTESVNYRYMRMKFDGKSEHVTADIIHIVKGDFVNIQITPAGGNVTVNNAPSMGDNFVAPNKEITFTATPNENENGGFMYWVEANTGRILGRETSLTVSSASGKDIKAVFADPAETEAFVSFYGRGKGTILATGYVKKGSAPTALVPSPEKLYTSGYEFSKWVDRNGKDIDVETAINENAEYYAAYTVKKDELKRICTITVNGGKVAPLGSSIWKTSGNFRYDITVCAKADEPAVEGEEFKYWMLNESIVSYDKEYIFYAPDADITLTAVFGPEDEAVTEKVQITITETSDVINGVNVAGFITTRYVPSGVKVIESGVIYVKDASYVGSGEDGKLTVADAGNTSANGKTVKVAFSSKTESGQHKLSASYTDLGIKAVGFITYVEGDSIITLYTDMITVK